MKTSILNILITGLSFTTIACTGEPVPATDVPPTQVFQVEEESTIKVKDGDTVYINETEWRFRCIDTPETYKNESDKGQPLGQEATNYLNQIVINDGIVMKETISKQTYDRRLGVPYTNSNENISIMLLKEGLALVEPRYTNCANMDRYYEAQRYAEQNKLGVWGLENMVTPWDYRHSQ